VPQARLSIFKIREVLRLSAKGLTQQHIAQRCRTSQSTVHRYLELAKAADIAWPLSSDRGEKDLHDALLGKRSGVRRRIHVQPDFMTIHKELQTNKNLTLESVWQRYKQQQPNGYSYSHFCDLSKEWCRCNNVTIGPHFRSAERIFAGSSSNIPAHESPRAPFDWMLNTLQGAMPLNALANELDGVPSQELQSLLASVTRGRLSIRNKAIAVLAGLRGISYASISGFLRISELAARRYCRLYREGGTTVLFARKPRATKKSDKESIKLALFALLHSPPSEHGINRTSWKVTDLTKVLREQGTPICADVIRQIIEEAGYKWRRARVVLTSTGPEYRMKVDGIKKILSELCQDEAFFSIDEYGPFAVKKKGGVKRVAPGQEYVVPQFQKSKGWMILTAALELSRNQVTHFYSRAKNTAEMVKMADLLRAQYRTCRTIYLSWDAASWHISKKLFAHLEIVNRDAAGDGYPIVKTAPLPAGAQFLNVIEAVFSGMARAIIHNSDYPSIEAAKNAIDRYYAERNAYFQRHPKRAGQKIWGKERVPTEFLEGQNCKDPQYR
jgi:transposase